MFSRDRFRTAVNVQGDCIGAAVVERFSKRQLEQLSMIDNDADSMMAHGNQVKVNSTTTVMTTADDVDSNSKHQLHVDCVTEL